MVINFSSLVSIFVFNAIAKNLRKTSCHPAVLIATHSHAYIIKIYTCSPLFSLLEMSCNILLKWSVSVLISASASTLLFIIICSVSLFFFFVFVHHKHNNFPSFNFYL